MAAVAGQAGKQIIRFGEFELDLSAQTLVCRGVRTSLQKHPFQLLELLVRRAPAIVSREEIRRHVWGDAVHIDARQSINFCIRQIRLALHETAARPRFIETLPRQGYRFIAPLEDVTEKTVVSEATPNIGDRHSVRGFFLWVGGAALTLGLAFLRWHGPPNLPVVTQSVRLTNDDFSKSPELVTDGARLYFSAWKGGRGMLAEVPKAGGDTKVMPTLSMEPVTSACVRGISPDKQNLLVVTGQQRRTLAGYPLWIVKASTLASHRVGDIVANDAAWSPDGRRITYATHNQIWIADADGIKSRKIAERGGLTSYPRWSPDGQRIRFTSLAWETYEQTIWEVPAEGGAIRAVFPGWHVEQWGGQWTPDGKYYVFNSESNLWAVRERTNWFEKAPKPAQITFGPLSLLAPLPSSDSKLYAVGEIRRGELLHYDARRAEFVSSFPGLSADSLDFSRDRKWMTYVTYPKNELWRSRVDRGEPLQLTAAPMKVDSPRWSPDGRQIVFNGKLPGEVWKAYRIQARGGPPQEVAPGQTVKDANWSPDGSQLVVTSWNRGSTSLSFLDLQTGKVSPVPGSKGLDGPHWSPDGRYISASRATDFACLLYDVSKQAWSEIAPTSCWWANWTSDSKSFFCLEGKGESIRRFDLATRHFEKVVSLRDYRITGSHLAWLGLLPDNSPLILKDAGSQELYALEWNTR